MQQKGMGMVLKPTKHEKAKYSTPLFLLHLKLIVISYHAHRRD